MKIGIVNDSAMATEVLRRIVASCPDHHLLWLAENGVEAVLRCEENIPDLVLMDLMMPVMNGVEATRRIMQNTPCAILVVTASVTGNSSMVFEAMGAGALDAVATPVLGHNIPCDASKELLRKIELIGKLIGCYVRKSRKNSHKAVESSKFPMIAIGASTGGPGAITSVLAHLPRDFPASVVVVQHMDQKFTHGLAGWLNKQIDLPVKIIQSGERPQKGMVLIPSTDYHMILTANGDFHYTKEPSDNFYHPSVDVFFESINQNWQGKIIGVLLTGMGRDGATGLLTLRESGHSTIAQDEQSSIVYGMPKAAKQLDAASEILPLDAIGPKIISLLGY